MPTVGIPANLLTTQAVGAALLHQFARDRFLEAGVEDRFLRDAEINLENLTTDLILLHHENGAADQSNQDDSHHNNNSSSDRMSDQSTLVNETSSICESLESNLSTATVVSPSCHQNGTATNEDQFHSMAETTTNSNGHTNDSTVYHSMHSGPPPTSSLDQLSSTSLMSVYGRELRLIAEEFARSRQRQVVKDQASKVELDNISKQSFLDLLDELFQGGVTREKIAVLFFFCTDVALRAVSCAQVDELGGWDSVLFKRMPSFLFSCLTILGICAILTYLHKNIRVSV